MFYGSKCLTVKKQHIQRVCVAEMRMLRLMYGVTRKDRKRNIFIREQLGIASIEDKMRGNHLR